LLRFQIWQNDQGFAAPIGQIGGAAAVSDFIEGERSIISGEGDIVGTQRLFRLAVCELSILVLGLTALILMQGCTSNDDSTQTRAVPRRVIPPPAAPPRPGMRSPRRTNAAGGSSEERHPSQWKRKLKAYYARGGERSRADGANWRWPAGPCTAEADDFECRDGIRRGSRTPLATGS